MPPGQAVLECMVSQDIMIRVLLLCLAVSASLGALCHRTCRFPSHAFSTNDSGLPVEPAEGL